MNPSSMPAIGRAPSRLSTMLALLLVSSGAAAQTPAQKPLYKPDGPRRVEVLFLGHASSHHNARQLAPLLSKALAPDGINITYTENPDDLNPERLAPFDALIIYANHATGTEPQIDALLDFVAAGGGFVPIHAGGGCFKNSEPYADLVGSRFLSHGTGTFTAEIVAADHPVMDGVEPFATWDETYVHTRHRPDRTILMERVDENGREPWTWTRTHGRGRIVYTAYGHDRRTWEQPMFQRLVRNAVLWSIGDQVRAQLAALAIPPMRYTDESPTMLIPDYVPPPGVQRKQVPIGPAESIRLWQVPPGFELQLFASEPEIVNPLAMSWDERGRLWVVETLDYPNDRKPDGQGSDRIRILEDADRDGRADRFTVFAEGLSIPTGFVFANGGVVVAQMPDFLMLKDTTGDDRADVRETVITGWGTRDTHAGPNNLQYGFDNWLWGVVGYSGFEGTVGAERLRFGSGVYRFRPDGSKLEFVSSTTNNTWGLGFSEAFDVFLSTANNEHSVFVAIPDRYYDDAAELPSPGRKKIDGHYELHPVAAHTRQVDSQGGFTSAAGHHLYTARSFPQEYWNRIAFVNEATGNLVHRGIMERDGSGWREVNGWNLMASIDEWTSPVSAQVGPDGALWILDWYSFIKQHNTPWPRPPGGMPWTTGAGNAYETPFRDRQHGRIYRLVWRGAPDYAPLSLSAERPQELVRALRHPNMFWRMTAQRLLVERGSTDVLPELFDIVADRSVDAIGLNAPAIHAIWTLHGLGALDGTNAAAERAVRDALTHPSPGVRKNAAMALPANLETFGQFQRAGVLHDADANVRLHVFRALADIPASGEVGRALFQLGREDAILEDEWLPTALFLAAARHAEGFLDAFADEVGALEFARIAGRAARGELGDVADLSAPSLDDAAWRTLALPATWAQTPLGRFTGALWVRRELELPASAAGAPATLHLGRVRENAVAFVNGTRLGEGERGADRPRTYTIPAGVLAAGRNVIALRVSNRRTGAGFASTADSLFLEVAGLHAPLAGDWKYEVEAEWPGGRPPDFVSGVPFAHQFLKYDNPFVGEAARRPAGDEPPAATVSLRTLPGQNRFDRSTIPVRAGQRVVVSFANNDEMPHNVVVLERGADVERAGGLLNEFMTQPAAAAADYVPPALAVIAAGPMVAPGATGTLTFTAPSEPGDYPFICSFPGHWLTMRGVLRVER